LEAAVIKDLLLPLVSYPKVIPNGPIRAVAELARHYGAHLDAVVAQIDVGSPLYYEGAEIGVFLDQANATSRKQASDLAQTVKAAAEEMGVACDIQIDKAPLLETAGRLVEQARLTSLSIVPVRGDHGDDRELAERLIFGSGRPVLIAPSGRRKVEHAKLDRIAIAWDGGKQAARAIADAMPILQRAAAVRIFTVEKDKTFESFRTGVDLAKHLGRYGLNAEIDSIEKAPQQTIGDAFKSYVAKHGIDLLVMGAYGHSRTREFVLGGATRGVLTDPPCWTLLSHG
jgi:nucleotide-binding universal stress UspA family protein